MPYISLTNLLDEVRQCRLCEEALDHEPRPVLSVGKGARILVVGQAPGTRVHETGIPWNDPSGDRLRSWMNLDRETFYDTRKIAIMPMGFCYPGKGKSGDLPPRKECASAWHARILKHLPAIELTLLIGGYAQRYYLDSPRETLSATVKTWRKFLPRFFPLVHPSPRNTYWLQQNPWFERRLIPQLRARIAKLL